MAFRRKYLEGALVDWANLDTWIAGRAKLDGEPTTDVTIALPASAISDPEADELDFSTSLERVRQARVATRRLDYALPGDDWVRRVTVTADGVLDRLRVLAEALAKAYGWTPAQASIFVLCGVTPFIATVRITRSSAKVRHHADLDWARRITLDIDPAATPQQVLDAFQHARRQQGLAQLHPLTLKHLRLAAFAGAEHADEPWPSGCDCGTPASRIGATHSCPTSGETPSAPRLGSCTPADTAARPRYVSDTTTTPPRKRTDSALSPSFQHS
jgi:hypothetical protein